VNAQEFQQSVNVQEFGQIANVQEFEQGANAQGLEQSLKSARILGTMNAQEFKQSIVIILILN
jgi:hypothetical protein